MATQPEKDWMDTPVRFADKKALLRMMDELNEQLGVVADPDITIEKLREMLLAEGVRPEDNELSREIIRMRNREE
jgi:hypothetical protein